MNKQSDHNMNPLSLFLLSTALGGGGYGAMRLLKEVSQNAAPKKEDNNDLIIDVPKVENNHIPHHKMGSDISERLMKVMAVAGGLPLGFVGAGKLYQSYKQKEDEAALQHAQEQYNQALREAKMKTGSVNTPLVDSLCLGAFDIIKEGGALTGMMGNWNSNFPGETSYGGLKSSVSSGIEKGLDIGTGGISRDMLTTLLLLGLGTGGLAYGAMNTMDKKKQDETAPSPDRVGIKYI